MSKYTPAPWEASLDSLEGDWVVDCVPYRVGKYGKVIVAEVHNTTDDPESREAEATARLIAAAPDLLEALEALIALDWEDAEYGWVDAFGTAEVAVAKARGES